jgi:hypothetical protein
MMSFIQFIVFFSIMTAILYLMVSPENSTGFILLSVVIFLVFIGFNRSHPQFAGAAAPAPFSQETTPTDPIVGQPERPHVTRVLTEPALPQVDALGRYIDVKMALDHTASEVVAPGSVNQLFETSMS